MSAAEIEQTEDTATETEETTEQTEERSEDTGSFATQDRGEGESDTEEAKTEGDADEEKAEASEDDQPPKYEEFTVPDGIELEQDRLESAHELFGSLGLDQEKAQSIVDWYIKDQATVAERAEAEAEQHRIETRKAERQEIMDHPELGGANTKETARLAGRALAVFDRNIAKPGEEPRTLAKLLDTMGWGDRLEMVDFLAAVGAAIKEDPGSGGGGAAADDGANPLDNLYPTMTGEEN